MDKLKAVLAILQYIPGIMQAIEPLYGKGMGAQKKKLVLDIANTVVLGGNIVEAVVGPIIDVAATSMNEAKPNVSL